MRLLYRADGGNRIGTGHLFRAARVLRELAKIVPLEAHLAAADDPLLDRIGFDADVTIHRLPQPFTTTWSGSDSDRSGVKPLLAAEPILPILAGCRFDLVAVDMLDTPEAEMRALAGAGVPLVTFDDRGAGRRFARAIVNILIEEPDPRSLPPALSLYQGGPYVVLDPPFADAYDAGIRRETGPLRSVFVAMGGADAAGLTVKVARALCQARGLETVRFVCGPAFPHRAQLLEVISSAPWKGETLDFLPNLIPCYRECDLAIVAGGLTMYEVCCTGTPALAVSQPIDHQLELSDRLAAAGAMATVGWGLDAAEEEIAGAVMRLAGRPDLRRRMAEIGPTIVDGRGARRVADVFAGLHCPPAEP
jgi:spore coat polysaccharide biosynthesis predicted glycosyltransferase SpsG